MKKSHLLRNIIAAVTAIALGAALAGCGSSQSNAEPTGDATSTTQPEPITLTASLNQWGSLAAAIGGDYVTVTSILSSTSVDAHDFEPTTNDVAALEKADVVLVNGAGYDSWADKTLAKDATRISVADTVGAVAGDNPHLWFSKDARNAVAKALLETFIKLRPDAKTTFNNNYEAWQQKETTLEETMDSFASAYSGSSYAATESLAYYLMSDMGLTDDTPSGWSQAMANDSEPAATDIKSFQDLLNDKKVELLVNNQQEENDTTKELVSLAENNNIAVLNVTEQMPSDFVNLTDWISSLVNDVVEDFKAGQASGDEASEDATQDEGTQSDQSTESPSATESASSDAE